MSRHKYFEQLCALAALGNLPPAQSREYESHLSKCEDCRKLSFDYGQVRQGLGGSADLTTAAVIESSRSRVRDLVWANIAEIDEGSLQKSRDAGVGFKPALAGLPNRWFALSRWFAAGVAAALIFWLGIRYDHVLLHPRDTKSSSRELRSTSSVRAPASQSGSDATGQRLQAENKLLASALSLERHHDEELQHRLENYDQQLTQAMATEASLKAEANSQAENVKATQAELDARKVALEQARAVTTSDSATVSSLELQVRDLSSRLSTETASLDRERDLLTYGRQIRDIIGARNLHVVDVYDASTEGTIKRPFARAFYTEGKSLVYYAFDLPERKADKGKYSYVAWGENSRSGSTIAKIGILYKDDNTQRRWSLTFNNPQVLSEIDSVFITLEPTGGNVTKPRGHRMLSAYLGTPPNHP